MDQVLRTAALWLLGSRNPAADCTRLRRRALISPEPIVPTPAIVRTPQAVLTTGSSASIGRTFEDRMINEVIPQVAVLLKVPSAAEFCRVTRQVAHSGDMTIHYRGQIGLVELKNHARALPVIDRRRFFDSLLINYKHLNWAILITSRCNVPRFGQKGYTIIGQIIIPQRAQPLPVAFICGFDSQGPAVLANAIAALQEGVVASVGPQWTVADLLEKGELTKTLQTLWGTGDPHTFRHPLGAFFTGDPSQRA